VARPNQSPALAVSARLLDIEPGRYQSHALHAEGQDWLETNCATDMWIEILHSLGLDPVAGLAFTVATDFGGDQWTMFTYPAEDLRCLYGVQVNELNVWRPLVQHVEEQIALGHLVSFDADAFDLPDTRGLTYGLLHQKTTICAQMIDQDARKLGYYHNAGYAELEGEDFDRVFHLGPGPDPMLLGMPPYTDQIRIDRMDPSATTLDAVLARLRVHLRRRPHENPVTAMTKRLLTDTDWLRANSMDDFHRYAFGTCRHLGANGQLAAAFVEWLDARDGGGLADVAARFREVSQGAKKLEFMLARVVAGRRVDIEQVMAPIEEAWAAASEALTIRYAA
jgi:Domain of unknown function (DUF1839)